MSHKAGFVSIIGYPNVGKSTLMNALIGEKLSIVTHKAQTTRHRIFGILSSDDFQVVYSDTPGIIKPHYLLHKAMMSAVLASINDADRVLLVTEINTPFENEEIMDHLKKLNIPPVVAINKIDLSDEPTVKSAIKQWETKFPGSPVIPTSALHKFNLGRVLDEILEQLPESPPFYPRDELTDRTERFFVSEIIREKILLLYNEEIPYSCEVAIESFQEKSDITYIKALIFVARESQKAIMLGHQGKAILKLGTNARKDIEAFLEKRVYLELVVKVEKEWRENDKMLRRFGYVSGEADKSNL
jgi:GTP-binding protein Era